MFYPSNVRRGDALQTRNVLMVTAVTFMCLILVVSRGRENPLGIFAYILPLLLPVLLMAPAILKGFEAAFQAVAPVGFQHYLLAKTKVLIWWNQRILDNAIPAIQQLNRVVDLEIRFPIDKPRRCKA